jgi:cysteinyl-tRNA synthetase
MVSPTNDGGASPNALDAPKAVPEAFAVAMDDDLNVPQALAVLHETVRRGNTALADGDLATVRAALGEVLAMTEVLGLDAAGGRAAGTDGGEHRAVFGALAVLVTEQLEARAAARAAKDWATADEIRNRLAAAGIAVEDSADGATWSLAQPEITTRTGA